MALLRTMRDPTQHLDLFREASREAILGREPVRRGRDIQGVSTLAWLRRTNALDRRRPRNEATRRDANFLMP